MNFSRVTRQPQSDFQVSCRPIQGFQDRIYKGFTGQSKIWPSLMRGKIPKHIHWHASTRKRIKHPPLEILRLEKLLSFHPDWASVTLPGGQQSIMGANLPFWNRVLPPLTALQLKMLYQKFGTKGASNKLSKFSLVDMFWLDGNFPWLICCVWRSRFLIIFCSPVLKHELGGELQIGQLFTKHCSSTFYLVDEFITFLRHFFSFQSE